MTEKYVRDFERFFFFKSRKVIKTNQQNASKRI